MTLSSGSGRGGGFGVSLVGVVAEHGEQNVAAAPGQADQGDVVFLSVGSVGRYILEVDGANLERDPLTIGDEIAL